jgi:hypothetical protein
MARKIMLLVDSTTVRSEAVTYAVELAKRTESDLFLLMILSPDTLMSLSGDDDLKGEVSERIRCEIHKHMLSVSEQGWSLEAEVKMGDARSELVKFLAGSSPFQNIVWGGDAELIRGNTRGRNAHWLANMKDMLKCPVVVPALKS